MKVGVIGAGALLLAIPHIAPESRSVLVTSGWFFVFGAIMAGLARSKTNSNAPAIGALIMAAFAFVAAFERAFITWAHTTPGAAVYIFGVGAVIFAIYYAADANGTTENVFGGLAELLAMAAGAVIMLIVLIGDLLEWLGTFLLEAEKRYILIEKIDWVSAFINQRTR